jgi:hypothetical protein
MSTVRVIFSFGRRPEAFVSGRADPAPAAGLVATLSCEEGRRAFGIDAVPDARAPLSDFLGPVAEALLRRLAERATQEGRRAVLEAFIDARRCVADVSLCGNGAFELSALATLTACPVRLFDGWVGMSATRFSRLVEEKDMSARSRCDEPLPRSSSPAWPRPAPAEGTSSSAAWPPVLRARRS